jgi:hypothetical protein
LNAKEARKKELKEQEKLRTKVNDIKIEMDSDDEDDKSDDGSDLGPQKAMMHGNSSSAIGGKLKVGAMNEL